MISISNLVRVSVGALVLMICSCSEENTTDYKIQVLTKDSLSYDYWPCVSPDGTTLVFNRIQDGNNLGLFSVSTKGGEVQPFVSKKESVSLTRANWSTRNCIALTGLSKSKQSSLWLLDAKDYKLRHVDVDGLSNHHYYPSWYPDGVHLAVMDGGKKALQKVNVNTQKSILLTDSSVVYTGMPSVSPNGKWVAFAGQKNTGKSYDEQLNSIWLLDENGEVSMLEQEGFQGRTPAWSPDGEWIAFESNRGNSDGLYAIYVIKKDGTSLRRITPYELNANHPVWVMNGKKIVFTSSTVLDEKNASSLVLVDVN